MKLKGCVSAAATTCSAYFNVDSWLCVCVAEDVSNNACRCRFVIGRERPGQQSEVATLIQQTLEQERRQRELLEQQYAQYDADDDEVRTTHDPGHR